METVRFAMVIHPAEEGGFWASFPELPGCFTQGDTLEELRENAREAVSLHLAAMRERGEALPPAEVMIETIEAQVEAGRP